MTYIDLNYTPKGDDLICKFYIEPGNGSSIENSSNDVAAESSIGTWTEIVTMEPEIAKKLKPRVFEIDKSRNEIRIAYPSELFEYGNMPQILSCVAGNVFGMKSVRNLRLLDIEFPRELVKSFKGPGFGIQGIRKILRIKERPLLGTIIKPKVGLNSEKHARVAYESWVGGCDIVKDDENLTNQRFNPFRERVKKTLRMRERAEDETGDVKVYMPNITAETTEMIRRAKFVEEVGGRYVMIDIITCGFSALQSIRDLDLKIVIHAHRAMHAAFTRNRKHGISMLTIAKISRLIGVDQLHIGTAVGKMEGPRNEVISIKDALIRDFFNIKPVFPVCSGGLHPGLVPELMRILGNDIIIQAGGGIHGHPNGTESGAMAMKQAIDAAMKGISLEQYKDEHKELEIALRKWAGSGK
ncbi:MAG: type III ribulose-bisphosphate carboxylase [Candidatus Altiarchaeales archaeon]|nr:MAG: type III ribulose-bisphosphate carboxylase [Candidatus Altiarchaeales archaeon]RLI95223.1 MAG: type III ribulose-bisphosphate carboxylase [Candidatus Altiarchaeales archaeon]RLI95257.1 MAG: type III ribulose-bisphosphate carboxylase [Candidatus Altiarchaeales archaeon]HDO82645.1 type III ribulose-bisphosphate carboxylase [Candidatus Altiarchaeales archaeon]HEX55294.1 type III ribulose-bisphosphate carboxylase [Candidatus Altiarchaeales archaeon]